MDRRKWRKNQDFVDAKQRLKDMEWAERVKARRDLRKADWDDPEDKLLYHQKKRKDERLNTLNRLVPKRICSMCKSMFVDLKDWVISSDRSKALCRSCFHRCVSSEEDDSGKEVRLDIKMFEYDVEKSKYWLKSNYIFTCRERADLSQEDVGGLMKWSGPYQSMIESGAVSTLRGDQLLGLASVLSVENMEELTRGVFDARYHVIGKLLAFVRIDYMGLTKTEFARRCGWGRKMQTRIENESRFVTSNEMGKILEVMSRSKVYIQH